jgi:hypothetical protein
MLESKDHQQNIDVSGALDLTFAYEFPAYGIANVKSAPLMVPVTMLPPKRRDAAHGSGYVKLPLLPNARGNP